VDEIEMRGDPPMAYLRSVNFPVWLVVRMLRDAGSADEFVRSSYIEPRDIAVANEYYEAHKEEIERAIAEEQAWAREVEQHLEASAAVRERLPAGAGRYRVRIRGSHGTEREAGTLFAAAAREVGDVINFHSEGAEGASVQRWRVIAVEADDDPTFEGSLLVEPVE
jgi:hypothetical protein